MPCHLHPAPKFDGGSSLGQEGWTKGARRPPVSQALQTSPAPAVLSPSGIAFVVAAVAGPCCHTSSSRPLGTWSPHHQDMSDPSGATLPWRNWRTELCRALQKWRAPSSARAKPAAPCAEVNGSLAGFDMVTVYPKIPSFSVSPPKNKGYFQSWPLCHRRQRRRTAAFVSSQARQRSFTQYLAIDDEGVRRRLTAHLLVFH